MSSSFCYYCVEYIKLDICVKLCDHLSKVMMGGLMPPITDGSKSPCQIGLRVKRHRSLSLIQEGEEAGKGNQRCSLITSFEAKKITERTTGARHILAPVKQ